MLNKSMLILIAHKHFGPHNLECPITLKELVCLPFLKEHDVLDVMGGVYWF